MSAAEEQKPAEPPTPPTDVPAGHATATVEPPPNAPKYEGPAFPPARTVVEEPTATVIGKAHCDVCGGKWDRNGFDKEGVLVQPYIGIAVPDYNGQYTIPFRLVCGECMADPFRKR